MYDQNIQMGRRVCCGNSYYNSYCSPRRTVRKRKHHPANRSWMAVTIIMACSFMIFLLTARPAEAGKEEKMLYKYYNAIEVDRGETLWSIAEEQLNDPETASEYKNIYAYMDEVMSINGIFDTDSLEAGQPLIVPYFSSEYKD